MNKTCHFCGETISNGGNSIYPFNYLHPYTDGDICCCDLCNAYIVPFRKLLKPENGKVSTEELKVLEYDIRESLGYYRKRH